MTGTTILILLMRNKNTKRLNTAEKSATLLEFFLSVTSTLVFQTKQCVHHYRMGSEKKKEIARLWPLYILKHKFCDVLFEENIALEIVPLKRNSKIRE